MWLELAIRINDFLAPEIQSLWDPDALNGCRVFDWKFRFAVNHSQSLRMIFGKPRMNRLSIRSLIIRNFRILYFGSQPLVDYWGRLFWALLLATLETDDLDIVSLATTVLST